MTRVPSPYRFNAVDFPANDFPKTIIFNPNAGNNGGGILSLTMNSISNFDQATKFDLHLVDVQDYVYD